ncbi:MAG: hypothetical protein PHI85_05800 [Victivallaceae bacterium]|nr:hypothetical protein [Victivallaceae bacterium]
MRRVLTGLALFAAIALAAQEGDSASQTGEPAAATEPVENGNFYNIGRGFVNIFTCFLEVPRGMVYRNSEIPFWGFVGGAVEGAGLTGVRALSGVTDVLFVGFDRGAWFNKTTFQDFVWDSEWLPKEK